MNRLRTSGWLPIIFHIKFENIHVINLNKFTVLISSDVNKDLGFKAKTKAKDLGFKAKTKAKDLSFKAKAKDLRFKAKAKAKDLTQVLESRPRTWGGKDQGPRPRTHHRVEKF